MDKWKKPDGTQPSDGFLKLETLCVWYDDLNKGFFNSSTAVKNWTYTILNVYQFIAFAVSFDRKIIDLED